MSHSKAFSELGATVSLAARRKDKFDGLVKEIEQAGGEVMAFATDVTKREDVEELVKNTITAFGKMMCYLIMQVLC